MVDMLRLFYKNILSISILFCYLSVIINNSIFYLALIILLVIYIGLLGERALSSSETKLLRFLPIIYYIQVFGKALQRKDLLFWDNQYLFQFFRCNINDYEYNLQLSSTSYTCIESLGFGPIAQVIKINIDPWFASIFLFLITFVLVLLNLIKVPDKYIFFVVIFILSPAFRFLILSLNSDMFVGILFLYLIQRKKLNLSGYDLILLTLFCQLKIYPVLIFLGISMYYFLSGKKYNFVKYAILFLLNVGILFGFYTFVNFTAFNNIGGVPYVFAPMYSFGLLADIFSYQEVPLTQKIGNFNIHRILLATIIFNLIIVYKKKLITGIKQLTHFEEKIIIIFCPVVLIINLFANYGYKFIFNSLIVFLVIKYVSLSQKIIILSAILFNPIFYLLNFDYSHQIFEASFLATSIWFISRLSFYILNCYLILFFLSVLNKKFKIRSRVKNDM